MNYDPGHLETVIDYHQAQAVESGHPPRNVRAWRGACRREMLDNEQAMPGYIERAANGLRARADGKRLTYCKEVRGDYAISHVWSPTGTDPPPSWWNRDAAKREHDDYEERNAYWLVPARKAAAERRRQEEPYA